MKKTTKLVFMSLVTIALCISLIAGATFALFTSDDSVNIAVSSGKVKVTAEAKDLTVYTTDQNDEDNEEARVNKWLEGSEAKLVDGQNVKLVNMTPGAGVIFTIDVTNDSNVAIKYQIQLTQKDTNEEESAYSLIDVLNVSVDGATLEKNGNALSTEWISVAANGEIGALTVDMYLPWSVNNYYQGLSCELTVTLYAVQGNGIYPAYVSDVDSLAAALNSNGDAPIVLTDDIDMSNVDWTPIANFTGTLDGNGKTISGLDNALLNKLDSGIVKNLTIESTEIKGQGLLSNQVTGTAKIDKVTVSGTVDSSAMKAGGLIGEINSSSANATDVTITNCVSDADVICANDYVGGIVGVVNNSASKATISNCVNNGDVSGKARVGGIVGFASGITIIDGCANYGTITEKEGKGAGGIVGFASTTPTLNGNGYYGAEISNCTNYGEIKSAGRTGHIVGTVGIEGGDKNPVVTVTISNCVADDIASVAFDGIDAGNLCGAIWDETGRHLTDLTVHIDSETYSAK